MTFVDFLSYEQWTIFSSTYCCAHPLLLLFTLDEVGIDISNHVGAFMSKADLGVRMQGKLRTPLNNYISKMPIIITLIFSFLSFDEVQINSYFLGCYELFIC